MTEREALKLALEALEEFGEHYDWCHQFPTYAFPENYPPCNCGYDEAITAIKEALMSVPDGAQPEQEPVKFEAVWDSGPTNKDYEDAMRLKRLQQLIAPPQRKPLTDGEILSVIVKIGPEYHSIDLARAIEAAHGIKGEA